MSVEQSWTTVQCTYCRAEPQVPCQGPNGKSARATHSARVLLAKKENR